MQVIFLGGVHGVGKTTLGLAIASQLDGEHFTASGLIRQARASNELLGDKRVSDLDGNQALLIAEFARVKAKTSKDVLLLDGHFVLTERSGQIAVIPTDIFRQLGVTYLICVVDQIEEIEKRLRQRDGNLPEGIDLDAMQVAEVERAKTVSTELAAALRFISPGDFIEGSKFQL